MRRLSDHCTIVFNSAATIRFVEPIDVAVKNNIYSVGQLIEFCNELENLEALIHLSTAYSNCHKSDTIHEIFYDPPMRGEQILKATEQLRYMQSQICVHQEETDARQASPTREISRLQKFYSDEVIFSASSSDGLIQHQRQANLQNSFSTASLALADDIVRSTPPINSDKLNRSVRRGKDASCYDLLAEFSRIALRMSNRPNTYTFTKAISESYLLDKVLSRPDRYLNDKIPVAIIRPSIVGGAWHEPIVGLVDNYNGPTGAILSLYTGALQAMPGCGERVADLVPVDMVTNMVISTGWFLGSEATHKSSKINRQPGSVIAEIKHDQGVYLFNFVSGYRNPMKWRQVTELIARLSFKYPSKFLKRIPSSYFIRAGIYYEIYDVINHKLPAFMMDLVQSRLFGRNCEGRTSSVVGYTRIKQMTETLTPFTSNQWRLSDTNVRSLIERLEPADRQLFPFDVASIDWSGYLTSYIIGSRIYTLRDDPKNVPRAIRALKKRKTLNSLLHCALLVAIYLIFFRGGEIESAALGWL